MSAPQEQSRASGQPAAPILRLIGAFAFHDASSTSAYSGNFSHSHEAVIIVEEQCIVAGKSHFVKLDQATKLQLNKDIHKSFAPGRAYYSACLDGWTLRVNGGGAALAAAHLPSIAAIAAQANGDTFVADLVELGKSKLKVEFGSGMLVSGEPTPAKGHEKTWKFKSDGNEVSAALKLTDVTDFVSGATPMTIADDRNQIVLAAEAANDIIYIVNLSTPTHDKTPNVLEHSRDFFELVKATSGSKPAKKPVAHCVENDLEPESATPLRLPCASDRIVTKNPPDTEFCIQMAI